MEWENVRRPVENIFVELKTISADWDLLRCKVEKSKCEKCCLKTEFLKCQQELALLRTQKMEGLPCSKKYTRYCRTVWQERKAKLARPAEEKAELTERLKNTERHLGVLRGAQVSCMGPEKEYVKSKPKLTIKEEILEKHGDVVVVSPPRPDFPCPPTSPLQKSFAVPYQEKEKLLHIKQEGMNVGGRLHTCLLKGQLGTLSSTSSTNSISHCLKAEASALPSSSAGDQKETGVVQGKLKKQMTNLIAERQATDLTVCVNPYRSTKDEDRVSLWQFCVLKTATSGEAPIWLFHFGWKARVDRSKVEKAPCLSGGARGGRELQVLNTQQQEDIMEWENVRRPVENIFVELKTISADWDLLRCKVEKSKREKCCLKTEFLKCQQELALLRTQKMEGLPCSKKYTRYCRTVWQERKAKLARPAEEKAELTERLKNTERHLGVLRGAQVSCMGPEKEYVKSVMEKLNPCMNVSLLLLFILPHLELQDINFELDQVDEILQTVLEETDLMLE